MDARGWTLVELVVVLAIAALLTATAWPSQREGLQRARRVDATAALLKLQALQEQHRSRFGSYAADLLPLTGTASARSADGLYALAVREAHGESVLLAAVARPDGAQAGDSECAEITLRLDQGLADAGPTGRCWGS